MLRDIKTAIIRSNKTIFSFKELRMLSGDADLKNLKSKINYYVKQGDLYHVRRGLYARNKDYDRLELATKLFIPSYVSFETVLRQGGIIFQYYETVFVATYQSRTVTCDEKTYIYRRIKQSVLTNDMGIAIKDNYSIATTERAFLDMVYIHKGYHFDNLGSLNWDKVFEILPIYENKSMEQRVTRYYSAMKESL